MKPMLKPSQLSTGLFVLLAFANPVLSVEPDSVPGLVREGNVLLEEGRWQEALLPFRKAINQHTVKHRKEKAEANYKIGICLEKLGQDADAASAYLSVIAVYAAEVEWSSRALECRVQITAKAGKTDDPVAEYKFLRRNSLIIQRSLSNSEPPEALKRVLDSIATIAADLRLTEDQIADVDRELGIATKQ